MTTQKLFSQPDPQQRKTLIVAVFALMYIAVHLALRWTVMLPIFGGHPPADWPLVLGLIVGGLPLVWDLLKKAFAGEFGSDLLAGLAMVTALLQGEYLAGVFVVLMLSGGQRGGLCGSQRIISAGCAAKRLPQTAHRRLADEKIADISLADVAVSDTLVVFPHEICPVDGTVIEGHGSMDESYLTREPYLMPKAPGATVFSGAINENAVLVIHADRLAVDSRYAKIMDVMRAAEQRKPRMRRLADRLGAFYTPLAVAIAVLAWTLSGEAQRFLAVLVVATPCPLLIGIPVAILGGISLSARRGIIIRDPGVLERIDQCRVAIFDKTGTLTYGRPAMTECVTRPGVAQHEVLRLTAALERYSRHPLAESIVKGAQKRGLVIPEASQVNEPPGQGLTGLVDGHQLEVTSRKKVMTSGIAKPEDLPAQSAGLECVVVIDRQFAAVLRFHDKPRKDGKSFVGHLPQHHFSRVMIVSGDRESEVRYLADAVGIQEVYFSQSPEQKLELVREQTRKAKTMYMGDGINDAPALTAATVGVAFGQSSDVTAEAASAVILESSLQKVDEFFHIGHRMRTIALQSAVGRMVLSLIGILAASLGYLPPVAGAICQELIDILAVVNSLRVAFYPGALSDMQD
ncbi:MAG: heavy metal translocating P-type ATPase [Planctomycetaceae bacterium]